VFAGLFAATMSTADSQVLSCSAAITQDLVPRPGASSLYNKLGTVIVTSIVLVVALAGSSVFALVVLAWSCLAASLGPLLVIRCMGWSVTAAVANAMILGGLLAVLGWKYGLGYGSGLNEALPGMLAGFAIYIVGGFLSRESVERSRV
jgi:sodium/proline symporter